MNKRRLLLLIIGSIILIRIFWLTPILEVKSLDTQELLHRIALPNKGRFRLYYIHSWDKTPIWEMFSINLKGDLILDREEYLWMGAGLDYHVDANIEFGHERVIVHTNRFIGELRLAVARVADYRIITNSEEIVLSHLAPPGSKLILKGRWIPWLVLKLKYGRNI